MKRINLILILIISILSSCASVDTRNYVTAGAVYKDYDVSYILETYYPELYYYYQEDVLRIKSIRENTLNGNISYDVSYEFCRYYYRNHAEIIECLRTRFPELYERYYHGLVDITSLYKYVEKRTGKIRYHVSYRRTYGGYYYTPRYHYYGPIPRPIPYVRPVPQPPRPNVAPPRPQPRPSNPPRGGGARGNNGGRR